MCIRDRCLRAAARVERLPVPVLAAFIDAQHDRGGGYRSVLRQRRGAMELHDGGRSGLLPATDRDLLRVATVHVPWPSVYLARSALLLEADIKRGRKYIGGPGCYVGFGPTTVLRSPFRAALSSVVDCHLKPASGTFQCRRSINRWARTRLRYVRIDGRI